MTLRTIEVSGQDRRLSLAHKQLVIKNGDKVLGTIPAAEIGLLVVDTPSASYTHPAMAELMEQGAAIVFCGPDHLPVGLALPVSGHHKQTERFRAQMESTLPTRKRLWQQIVRAKIESHALACDDESARKRLVLLVNRVKPGDPSNVEAQAAKVWWSVYMPDAKFRRNRDGPFPNALLNYGYMMMRAAVARSLVAAGFHPSLGLRHSNKYNSFCLADDFVEILRPLIDVAVRRLVQSGSTSIEKAEKTALLSLLTHPVETPFGIGPLQNAFEPMCLSFHRCLLGEDRDLFLPRPLLDAPTALAPAEDQPE